MSGPGGGSFGSGIPAADVACELLEFNTQISSPKASVIAHIQVGDVLSLSAEQQGPAQVLVIRRGADVAGGITSPRMARLIECILLGTKYQVAVTEKSGGQVSIRVSPVI